MCGRRPFGPREQVRGRGRGGGGRRAGYKVLAPVPHLSAFVMRTERAGQGAACGGGRRVRGKAKTFDTMSCVKCFLAARLSVTSCPFSFAGNRLLTLTHSSPFPPALCIAPLLEITQMPLVLCHIPSSPLPCRRICDGMSQGVVISGAKGRLERCNIAGNKEANVHIQEGADPTILACK